MTALFVVAVIVAAASPVFGQNYPTKPIRIIVTGTPGSHPDIVSRWLAERLMPELGKPVIAQNKPGAGGNIAMQAAAKSAPDGYTLVMAGQGPFALNPHMYANPGYDPFTHFSPITQIERGALLLAVHPGVPANTLGELLKLARDKPGQLNYGSPGTGTPPHMAAELLSRMAKVDVARIPYTGPPAAMTDLLAGRLTYTFGAFGFQSPYVKTGKLRALAVTSAKRIEALPDVPTIAESGLPGFEYSAWQGVAAPAGTPKNIIERLHAEIVRILRTPQAREYFAAEGREAVGNTPDRFIAYIRTEHAKWGAIIREAGIRAE